MKAEEKKELWEQCAKFHGHVCGGLTIGYKAALYAMELFGTGIFRGRGSGMYFRE